MAKANIVTILGTKITIEGDPQEVASVIKRLEMESNPGKQAAKKGSDRSSAKKAPRSQRATPVNLVSSLIDGGFFRKPKDLGAVKTALEELGHFYPVTTLSPALLRLVRKRQLRRIKEKKRWLYTG
jgi:hypothetical protein